MRDAARRRARRSRRRTVGERLDVGRRPAGPDRPARRVGEAPRQRPRTADEDLGADRRHPIAVALTRPMGRPAVDRLDVGPASELQVRPGIARLDEGVPGGRVDRSPAGCARRWSRRARAAERATMIPTIAGSSAIRNARATTQKVAPKAAVTTVMTSRIDRVAATSASLRGCRSARPDRRRSRAPCAAAGQQRRPPDRAVVQALDPADAAGGQGCPPRARRRSRWPGRCPAARAARRGRTRGSC